MFKRYTRWYTNSWSEWETAMEAIPIRRGSECYFADTGPGESSANAVGRRSDPLSDDEVAVRSLSHAVSLSSWFEHIGGQEGADEKNDGVDRSDDGSSQSKDDNDRMTDVLRTMGANILSPRLVHVGDEAKTLEEVARSSLVEGKIKQCEALGYPGDDGSTLETILRLIKARDDGNRHGEWLDFIWFDILDFNERGNEVKPTTKSLKKIYPRVEKQPLEALEESYDAEALKTLAEGEFNKVEGSSDFEKNELEVLSGRGMVFNDDYRKQMTVKFSGQTLLDAWWLQVMKLACGKPGNELGYIEEDVPGLWPDRRKGTEPEAPPAKVKVPACTWAATSNISKPHKHNTLASITDHPNANSKSWNGKKKITNPEIELENVEKLLEDSKRTSLDVLAQGLAFRPPDCTRFGEWSAIRKQCKCTEHIATDDVKEFLTSKKCPALYWDPSPAPGTPKDRDRILKGLKNTNPYLKSDTFKNKCFQLGKGARQETGVPIGDPRRCFRWARNKDFFDTPYVAYDEIRKGWETTWFQICQPLKDWKADDVVGTCAKGRDRLVKEQRLESVCQANAEKKGKYDEKKAYVKCKGSPNGDEKAPGDECTDDDFKDADSTCCRAPYKFETERRKETCTEGWSRIYRVLHDKQRTVVQCPNTYVEEEEEGTKISHEWVFEGEKQCEDDDGCKREDFAISVIKEATKGTFTSSTCCTYKSLRGISRRVRGNDYAPYRPYIAAEMEI